MIHAFTINPSIIDDEKIKKNFSSYESLRRSFANNLILVHNLELKKLMEEKIKEINNKPGSSSSKLFIETILNCIAINKKEYISSTKSENDIEAFCVNEKKNNKHLLAYITENNAENIDICPKNNYSEEFNKLEKICISTFTKSKFYLKALKDENGPEKKIDKMTDDEFNFFMENILWNTREVNFIDNTFGETPEQNRKDVKKWHVAKHKSDSRNISLKTIADIIEKTTKIKGEITINIYTLVPPVILNLEYKSNDRRISFQRYKEETENILPKNKNKIKFKIHFKDPGPNQQFIGQLQHIRLMEVNSTILSTDLGTDFVARFRDGAEKRKHCRFSRYPFLDDVNLMKDLKDFRI